MNLHPVLQSKLAKAAVAGQKDAPWILFRQRECKSIMNRQMRKRSHQFLRPQDTLARKIHYLQASTDKRLLLLKREFDEFLLK